MRNNRLVKSTASLLLAVTVSFSSVMVASATETTSTNAAKTPQYAQSHYPSEAEIEAYLNDPQYKKYGRTREDVEAYLKANAEEDAATTTTMEAGLYSFLEHGPVFRWILDESQRRMVLVHYA